MTVSKNQSPEAAELTIEFTHEITVGELKNQLTTIFQAIDPLSSQQHIHWLFETLLKRPYAQIILHPKQTLNAQQHARISQWANAYIQHKPIAYILEKTEFMGLELIVNEDVLIPRSDTEAMVIYAIDLLKQKTIPQTHGYEPSPTLHILELGTGSGAIAIALAHLLSIQFKTHIIATDKSPAALSIAQKNAHKHQVDIQFKCGDWFEAISVDEKFDLIISNPPYIGKTEVLETSLHYEPKSALYADDDGLSDIRTITRDSSRYLNTQGILFIEHGISQGEAIRGLFAEANYQHSSTHQDLAGRERFSVGQK